jgi:cytochrome bd-type quinol oxidase subunit 2
MAEPARAEPDAARIIFYVAAVLMVIYGLGLLLFPQVMFNLTQDPGVPANPGWVRWGGGLLLGTAVAAWLAANNPESQRPLVVGLGTAFTLIALALLYSSLVGDYRGV